MKTETGTVTVTIGKDEAGKDKDFSKTYEKKIYESREDFLGEMQNDATFKTLVSNLNYAVDLKLRAGVRQQIINEAAGPEKATETLVKQLMKQRAAVGKPISEEKARALVAALGDD